MKKQRKLRKCNPHVLADVTRLVEFVLKHIKREKPSVFGIASP